MTIGNSFGQIILSRIAVAGLTFGLLLIPSSLSARSARLQSPEAGAQSADEKRDADEARQEKEQERRDREQEKLDSQQELYDNGREALDDDHYEKAAAEFAELIKLNGPQTDAAMYWKAYAENRLGKKAAALATISIAAVPSIQAGPSVFRQKVER